MPAVQRQMAALGLSAPIDEVGPAVNTHDEALLVARLARKRGWKQVLLVTSPAHTRRARATFLKAGLQVLVRPSPERDYELSSLNDPVQRLRAFRHWIYEWAGWHLYQRRGWV
jgi:uncharacterized SAM-binding protein YcdF (DUF218 family)